ncbi:hypothetical protein HD554DRAFT_131144 [Boletus coccyginus]|nr:hypothetical protein HD554DRAFT_131144 [Boletus coccyginus]
MRFFWNLSDLAWPLHVKLMFRRTIVCSIFLLQMSLPEFAMLLTRFTRPVSPHLTRTPVTRSFLLARHRAAPFLPFLAASLTRALCQARQLTIILSIATICHQMSSLLFYGKSRVNSCVPLQRQSACSMGKSALTLSACCSSITSASTDCRIGLYSTQKAPEI